MGKICGGGRFLQPTRVLNPNGIEIGSTSTSFQLSSEGVEFQTHVVFCAFSWVIYSCYI